MKAKSQSITVRKATPTDVSAFVEMWQEFVLEHEQIVLRKAKALKSCYVKRNNVLDTIQRYFGKNIRSRSWGMFLAELDGEAAGYLTVTVKKPPPVYNVERIGYIDSIFIRKPFRGTGLSSRFRETAIAWFRDKNLSHMSLNVSPQNSHARSIYQGWGFLEYRLEMRMKI